MQIKIPPTVIGDEHHNLIPGQYLITLKFMKTVFSLLQNCDVVSKVSVKFEKKNNANSLA